MPHSSSVYLFLVSALGFTACDDEGLSRAPRNVAVSFSANVAGSAAQCGDVYANLGSTGAQASLADARFFVSNVQQQNALGEWIAIGLDQDSDWQHKNIALLDFEDGSTTCADSGTEETNTTVRGTLPAGDYQGLRFDIGVPFALNHNDNATAPAPLNVPGMFWTWQGGYKFIRVDWMVKGDVDQRWNIHIGSTGCTSDAKTIPPEEACAKPNASRVELTGFDTVKNRVMIDLAQLIRNADITQNTTDSPPGCQSNPMEPTECTVVFSALGVDFSQGSCLNDCIEQNVFALAEQ